MLAAKDKFTLFTTFKNILAENGFLLTPYKEIEYGLQFEFQWQKEFGLIRIYEGKRGLRVDLSQIKNSDLVEKINHLMAASDLLNSDPAPKTPPKPAKAKEVDILAGLINEPNEMIGIDESGKGDYFGPLVIGAVHVNPTTKNKLTLLGVRDSKTLNDQKNRELAESIKELCPHSLVIIGNKSYNDLYLKMKNLNHLLAWGHARVLENVLTQTPCEYAMSDQFGQASLINNALLQRGKKIHLIQKHRAEQHLAVAAASILARASFLENLEKMSTSFSLTFPKGSSHEAMATARVFLNKYGRDALNYVAKLHFNLTAKLS